MQTKIPVLIFSEHRYMLKKIRHFFKKALDFLEKQGIIRCRQKRSRAPRIRSGGQF